VRFDWNKNKHFHLLNKTFLPQNIPAMLKLTFFTTAQSSHAFVFENNCYLERHIPAMLRGRLHGAFWMASFISDKPFVAETCDIEVQQESQPIKGRLHGAFSISISMSDKPFDAEARDIGGQASATNGLSDMKTPSKTHRVIDPLH
jgi:hypothetical protein